MTKQERSFTKMFSCDVAEVKKATDTYFLILGWKRSTKDDTEGQWYKNGEPFHFKYVHRQVVASGKTLQELRKSADTYKRLEGMSWEEFFKEYAQQALGAS
jgi:hypothetical protein